MSENVETEKENLPPDINDWTTSQVKKRALKQNGVDVSIADLLFGKESFIHAQAGKSTEPYPFGRNHDASRYIERDVLCVPESGLLNLIEPCHEFKGFYVTPDEKKLDKFTTEVIRFAAACMNSRTNGTIHFGIGDKPDYEHGQVLGVAVDHKEKYINALKSAIDRSFEHKHKAAAQTCIKPPRFVGILNRNTTSSGKYVIEVDIEPQSAICGENYYHVNITNKEKKKIKDKFFYIRDGGSTRDLLAPTTSSKPMLEYKQFVNRMPQISKRRKNIEENHLKKFKNTTHASCLINMITGGNLSLDKSHFTNYIIVTNKSPESHLENLKFFIELKPIVVLDFDPESAKHGLLSYFKQQTTVSSYLPANYKISVKNNAVQLGLSKNIRWVLCNGGIEQEEPSDVEKWSIEKGTSVRNVISFLCGRDVLPNRRFLVIFLLFSAVREKTDPLVETFYNFREKLGGTGQILCICNNKNTFISWKDLIEARCGVNISDRCIYELSFAEANGTILSLWSENRRAKRFLPSWGRSKVALDEIFERSLNTLEILCVNQCEGGNEDRAAIEENFYRGGNVSWWNFHFSEQPGSPPFIKRDTFDYIKNYIRSIPNPCSQTKACTLLNLLHVPGCGGTTLAMHVLWTLRDSFRCAVLKSKSDFADVADQVIKLLTYSYDEQTAMIPVLLMIDDFDDMEKVYDLKKLIENKCPQATEVIILNCMRSHSYDLIEKTSGTVFIDDILSEMETRQLEVKCNGMLKELQDIQTRKQSCSSNLISAASVLFPSLYPTETVSGPHTKSNESKVYRERANHEKLIQINQTSTEPKNRIDLFCHGNLSAAG